MNPRLANALLIALLGFAIASVFIGMLMLGAVGKPWAIRFAIVAGTIVAGLAGFVWKLRTGGSLHSAIISAGAIAAIVFAHLVGLRARNDMLSGRNGDRFKREREQMKYHPKVFTDA